MNKTKLLTGGLAAAGMLGTYAAAENTLMLRTAHYETDIPGLPRLVQLSDLHKRQFGMNQNRLIRRVTALKPCAISPRLPGCCAVCARLHRF